MLDPDARRLLEAFDGVVAADPESLAVHLRRLGDPEHLRALAEQLVGRGWLEQAGEPDCYVRTEEGRLAVAGPLDVTLYTRPGCQLCEEAKIQIAPLLAAFGATLREVNVDSNPALRERYGRDVPVILLGRSEVARHRVDLNQFRRQLGEARQAARLRSQP